MNQFRCFICNHNLTKIKTMYLFDFYFNNKREYVYLCDKHHQLCNHNLYQKNYTTIDSVKKKIEDNYKIFINKNPTYILYNERKYQRFNHEI